MSYIIYHHPESDSIGFCTRNEWNDHSSYEHCYAIGETDTPDEATRIAKEEAERLGLSFTPPQYFITPDVLNLVAEFHRLFNHPILDEPQIPKDRAELRYELLREELQELREAIDKGDLIGVADAFADLQYVLGGAILEFGMGERFLHIFHEVQRSNMSKACATEHEADLTIEHYSKAYDCYKKERNGRWFVYRLSDNKSLKSVGYSPADIRSML